MKVDITLKTPLPPQFKVGSLIDFQKHMPSGVIHELRKVAAISEDRLTVQVEKPGVPFPERAT